MEGTKIDWGHDLDEPIGVKINLSYVGKGMTPEEKIVKFVIGGNQYVGWMPDYSVNEDMKWLKAFRIADFDDGRWLVQIPDETLISGAKIFVPKEDQDTVVTSGWW